mgnify:CR=1 FL=1
MSTTELPQTRLSAVPDARGRFGEYGRRYVPETLMYALEQLTEAYESARRDPEFDRQLRELLRHFVGRPNPLYFAERLTQKCGGAQIYFKREDLNHTGAHKINNTIGQILLAQRLGKKRIIAETGAGQHGVATATVCALKGVECIVYMGEKDIERQAPNVARMKMLGAKVVPATSGSKTLKDATNEAIRDWINHPNDTHYIIGSVVGPHPYPDMVARFAVSRTTARPDYSALAGSVSLSPTTASGSGGNSTLATAGSGLATAATGTGAPRLPGTTSTIL